MRTKKYSYSPYDPATRKLLPYITKAFISHATITADNYAKGRLVHNGVAYTLVRTDSLLRFLLEHEGFLVIKCSFQHHLDEYVAIANTIEVLK
jgi:hypothetical protein